MSTGMGMGFGPGSEIRMKFEVVESRKENYMYLTTMGGNVSINYTAAQSFGHRADIVGATPIQVYTGVRCTIWAYLPTHLKRAVKYALQRICLLCVVTNSETLCRFAAMAHLHSQS